VKPPGSPSRRFGIKAIPDVRFDFDPRKSRRLRLIFYSISAEVPHFSGVVVLKIA
jgi:hypothetical protein